MPATLRPESATPQTLSAGSAGVGKPLCLYDEGGDPVALLSERLPFNVRARLALDIVRRFNQHDDLIVALRDAREFMADELGASLRDACLIRGGKPDRATLHEICAPFIENLEARLAKVDAALAKAGA